MMQRRRLTIDDYGKDYGFSRYVASAKNSDPSVENEKVNSSDPRDVLDLVNRWIVEGVKS
jgi:hypothetical protein